MRRRSFLIGHSKHNKILKRKRSKKTTKLGHFKSSSFSFLSPYASLIFVTIKLRERKKTPVMKVTKVKDAFFS